MRKLMGFVATIACSIMLVTLRPQPAAANAAADGAAIGAFCKANNNLGFASTGECASFVATLGPTLCKQEVAPGVEAWEQAGFKNRGECISFVQQFYRDFLKNLP